MKPDVVSALAYIATTGEKHDKATVEGAFAAEQAAQARKCRVPATGADWPADLVEALHRRVLVNITMRSKPLGVEAAITDACAGFVRVGGRDPEVRRLEAPHRKRPVCG